MNHTVSPMEFLLTNAVCFALGAVSLFAAVAGYQAAYAAGQRSSNSNKEQPAA